MPFGPIHAALLRYAPVNLELRWVASCDRGHRKSVALVTRAWWKPVMDLGELFLGSLGFPFVFPAQAGLVLFYLGFDFAEGLLAARQHVFAVARGV